MILRLGMLTAIVALLGLSSPRDPSGAPLPRVGADCRFRGFELKGRVQLVRAFPDVRVQIVQSSPDLRVQKVRALPDSCGEWQVVEAFPDLRVEIVEAMPDLRIQLVETFPGPP